MSWLNCLLLLVLGCTSSTYGNRGCAPRHYGEGKVVCVCTESYCDEIDEVRLEPKGGYLIYTSSRNGQRLERSTGTFDAVADMRSPAFTRGTARSSFAKQQTNTKSSSNATKKNPEVRISVDRETKYQKILGFGGAFTDAAGINIRELPDSVQQSLISSYYGSNGIGYSVGRVPMGGTDFSPRPYTYDDNPGDVNLTKFKLQEEDYMYKIPFIKMAKSLFPKLRLFASPWSAPPWMKTNNDYWGRGLLRQEFYQVWADYFVKFLRSYEKEGLEFWGVTTQNEPLDGLVPFFPFNSMGWTSSRMRDWIKTNLGPTLKREGYADTKIITLDENTVVLPHWIQEVFSDAEAAEYVSGIGIHWYSNFLTKYEPINETHYLFPDKFILGTEACAGFLPWEREKVIIGSWERGEAYAEDIIRDLQNWVVGWTDWNLALSTKGGPNWAKLAADSPIIVNKTSKEFYKQPMFYALAHVSKFFTPDSTVISVDKRKGSRADDEVAAQILAVAAHRPDNSIAVILLNKNDQDINVTLWDEQRGLTSILMPQRSIQTLLYF